MSAGQDDKVSAQETQAIYQNFTGAKHLTIFQEAGYENYQVRYKQNWTASVADFMSTYTEHSVN